MMVRADGVPCVRSHVSDYPAAQHGFVLVKALDAYIRMRGLRREERW